MPQVTQISFLASGCASPGSFEAAADGVFVTGTVATGAFEAASGFSGFEDVPADLMKSGRDVRSAGRCCRTSFSPHSLMVSRLRMFTMPFSIILLVVLLLVGYQMRIVTGKKTKFDINKNVDKMTKKFKETTDKIFEESEERRASRDSEEDESEEDTNEEDEITIE